MRPSNFVPVLALAGAVSIGAVFAQPALVEYEIVDGGIPEPLTDISGDRFRGELIVRDPTNASCLICHSMPIPDEPDPGNIGPDLAGIANRYTEAELRLRLVDPKVINPDTVMPAYYSLRNLYRVEEQYVGRTIYSAQDVEDVIAYLMTLTGE
jgi:sulfur-oxidizing protein SoxX